MNTRPRAALAAIGATATAIGFTVAIYDAAAGPNLLIRGIAMLTIAAGLYMLKIA